MIPLLWVRAGTGGPRAENLLIIDSRRHTASHQAWRGVKGAVAVCSTLDRSVRNAMSSPAIQYPQTRPTLRVPSRRRPTNSSSAGPSSLKLATGVLPSCSRQSTVESRTDNVANKLFGYDRRQGRAREKRVQKKQSVHTTTHHLITRQSSTPPSPDSPSSRARPRSPPRK